MTMERVIISAPFGNYLQWPGTTPTLGTYTLNRRRGRWWRVLRTVRFYHRPKAWINKLGLRNPGIEYLQKIIDERDYYIKDKILSIHGFNLPEWQALCEAVKPYPFAAIELNISCPNVPNLFSGNVGDYNSIFATAQATLPHRTLIAKLPPVGYEEVIPEALKCGINHFHCFNSLPTPGGGLSGKPLLTLYPKMISDIRKQYISEQIQITAGGGISCLEDAQRYFGSGADRVAVGSALFFPWNWKKTRRIAAKASELAENAVDLAQEKRLTSV